MGKLNIWSEQDVAAIRPDVQYSLIDVSALPYVHLRQYMAKIHELIENNVISPLPQVHFKAENVREALLHLKSTKHIGKVVCIFPQLRCVNEEKEALHSMMFQENATYLITGGLTGIGFEVCKWMLKNGAKYIVLAARNEASLQVQRTISRLEDETSAKVMKVQLDVANLEECKVLLERTIPEADYRPLRGITHAAGVLSDGMIVNQNWDRLFKPFDAKITGTWNLHELTKTNYLLNHFVIFSSVVSILGKLGQSNHAAGNSFEDTLAHYRTSIGLPALSINWGIWGEVGIATKVVWPGLKQISNLLGISGLEAALKSHLSQVAVLNIDSFDKLQTGWPFCHTHFDQQVVKDTRKWLSAQTDCMDSRKFWEVFNKTKTEAEKTAVVEMFLEQVVRKNTKMNESDKLENQTELQDLGMDSMMRVEIRNDINKTLGGEFEVNLNAILKKTTVEELVSSVLDAINGSPQEKNPTLEEMKKTIREDSQLAENIRAQPDQEKIDISKISVVLLTGATGTLGPYILRELCRQPHVTQIYCLIRSKKGKSCLERLQKVLSERDLNTHVDWAKIKCISGNIASRMLGMEPQTWDKLSNTVEAVINMAVVANHVDMYLKTSSKNSMRATNVVGLKNILEFCCSGTKLKHLYHAASIVTMGGGDEEGIISENWPNLSDFDNTTLLGYPVSKFINELIMKEAITKRGIPSKVFRIPMVFGDSETGQFVLQDNHMMLRILFSLKHRIISNFDFPMVLFPVDICARITLDIFFHPDAENTIYNVYNRQPDSELELVSIAKLLGYDISIIDSDLYLKKIQKTPTGDSQLDHFSKFYQDEDNVVTYLENTPSYILWKKGVAKQKDCFMSRKIAKLIPKFYEGPGKIPTMQFILKDLMYAKEHGVFKKFEM